MSSPQSDQEPSESTRRPVVLVVDDDRDVRRLLMEVLRRRDDLDVREAGSGEQAQAALEGGEVDVAIVDLVMPDMGGLQLVEWARDRELDVTWIILSGRAKLDDAIEAMQLGAFDFITKPLDSPESLLVTVRNALAQRELTAERQRLHEDLQQRNAQLSEQVAQLEEACRLLCRQQETIDQDLHRAELIQRALLPYVPPPMESFGVDVIYRPSRDVGGDLYDVVRVDDRHVVAYVADAAGHGVSAAMLAVLFKHRIGMTDGRTRLPISPASVLARVNSHLRWECRAPGLFVTAAYVLLDLTTGTATVASAGHTPLVVLRADGSSEMIYHTGPALGLSPEAGFAEKSVTLDEGDRMVLYTDGLYDAVGTDEPAPGGRVADALAELTGDGWERLHQMLNLADGQRERSDQQDDITAMILSAGQSTSSIDNGQPMRANGSGPSLPSGTELLAGRDEDRAAVSVAGQGSWLHCTPFHNACLDLLRSGYSLTVDLSLCQHLDSTFLGTLQEVVAEAEAEDVPLRIQGVLPAVRELFEELGMKDVLRRIDSQMAPLPTRMCPLTGTVDDDEARRRMLRAHEALASLGEHNREEFAHLIEHLREEIQRLEKT